MGVDSVTLTVSAPEPLVPVAVGGAGKGGRVAGTGVWGRGGRGAGGAQWIAVHGPWCLWR